MKNNTQPKLHISLSKEHNKYQSDVANAFKGMDVSFDGGLMRFSAEEMAMQVIVTIGTGVVSSAVWDLIKVGIKKLHKKFSTARITLRDSESVMYTVKADLSVTVLVVPDRMKEFEHIKTVDDLIIYFNNKSKQSIDTGWQLIPVSDVFTFVKSYAFSRDNLSNGILSGDKIGNIHYGDIHATFTSENIDLSKVEIPIVKEAGFSPKKDELLKDGDLIMADASEDYDGIGVTISVHGIGKNKVVGGLHTFVLRDEKGKTSEYYRQYIFLNKEIRNKLQKVANGVSVYGISKTALSKMELPLPSLPEQDRIVSVLETWDKSIEKLTQKIEAKKQIKKGLMRDLLTGEKRLSGFDDKWTFTTLGETCKQIKTGKLDANAMVENGKYRFYTCAKDFYHINDYAFDAEALLISGNGANLGYVHYYKGKFNAYQRTYVLYDFVQDILFIKYLLDLFLKTRIKEEVREGNTPYITMDTLTDMSLKIPSIEEQNVIAEILTTADKEITELEKKLSILKEQKRYLLNNLITGTIRTPETLSTKLTK